MSKLYACENCGAEIRLPDAPSFCPYCGDGRVGMNSQSAITARKMIAKLEDLAPKCEAAWEEYVRLRAQYDQVRMIIGPYVGRGIISKAEIPTVKKTRLSDALKEHREALKMEGETE